MGKTFPSKKHGIANSRHNRTPLPLVVMKSILNSSSHGYRYSYIYLYFAKSHSRDSKILAVTGFALVRPRGFEPPARSLGNCCSIHLSYGRMQIITTYIIIPCIKRQGNFPFPFPCYNRRILQQGEMRMIIDLDKIATEGRSEASRHIDTVTTEDLVRIINDADKAVAAAVEKILPAVAAVIDKTAVRIRAGGRLIYVGAGTSGRLGVLDAAECPPTYNTPPELVQALLAGGKEAMFRAVEGEEDKPQQGAADIRTFSLTATDTVIGLSASGRTPYVIGALACAKERGAYTVSVTSSPGSKLAAVADRDLCALTGPEVVTGSTRMKAGTAEK